MGDFLSTHFHSNTSGYNQTPNKETDILPVQTKQAREILVPQQI
jgi:hypothetical protein